MLQVVRNKDDTHSLQSDTKTTADSTVLEKPGKCEGDSQDILENVSSCEPLVPIIVEDNPTDKKTLKSCLRTKIKGNGGENSESESDLVNTSSVSVDVLCNGSDSEKSPSQNSERKSRVRFFLKKKKKGEPRRIANAGAVPFLTKFNSLKCTSNLSLSENGMVDQTVNVADISSTNSTQRTDEMKTGYRRKHDTCVTEPLIGPSANSLFYRSGDKTVDATSAISQTNTEKESLNSVKQSCGSPGPRHKANKNFKGVLTKESVSSDSCNTVDQSEKKGFTIMEKLHIANTVPHSTLSSAITKELEVRKKAKLSKKYDVAVIRPRQNVILRKPVLTNTCASMSMLHASDLSEKQGFVSKDNVTVTNSTQRIESMKNITAGESTLSGSNISTRIDTGNSSQVAELRTHMFSPRKQKQTGSSVVEFSGGNLLMVSSNIQKSSESPLLKMRSQTLSKAKWPAGSCDSKSHESEVIKENNTAFSKEVFEPTAHDKNGKSMQIVSYLDLFKEEDSVIVNRSENEIFEDFGSLAQKLKRCRKSPVPIKLIKNSPKVFDSKNAGGISCSPPKIDDKTSEPSSSSPNKFLESFHTFVCESGSLGQRGKRPISPEMKKQRPKRDTTYSKNNGSFSQQTEHIKQSDHSREQNTHLEESSNKLQNSNLLENSNQNPGSIVIENTLLGNPLLGQSTRASNRKNKCESIKPFIAGLSKCSGDILKSVSEKQTTNLLTESSSQSTVEYLDLAGTQKKKKKRKLIALTSEVMKNLAQITPKLQKSQKANTQSETMYICSDKSASSPSSNVTGNVSSRKGRKGSNSPKQKGISKSSDNLSNVALNSSSVLESKTEQIACSSATSVNNENAKLSSSSRDNKIHNSSRNITSSPFPYLSLKRCNVNEKKERSPIIDSGKERRKRNSSPISLPSEQISDIGKARRKRNSSPISLSSEQISDGSVTPKILLNDTSCPLMLKRRRVIISSKLKSVESQKERLISAPVAPCLESSLSSMKENLNATESSNECLNVTPAIDDLQPPSYEKSKNLKTHKTKSVASEYELNSSPKRVQKRVTRSHSPVTSTTKISHECEEQMSSIQLTCKYSTKNCCVKMEKLTSEDIKKHSGFIFRRNSKKMSSKPGPFTKILHNSSTLNTRRNVSVLSPENIPRLHKVMEDVITSDDESWIGWNSMITNLEDPDLQLVSVVEGSEVIETIVSVKSPFYPPAQIYDKSTSTADLDQF